MDKPQWDRGALDTLIGQQESIRLEFKSSHLMERSLEAVVKELSLEASAFANTEGGTIIIGIEERKEGKVRLADKIDSGVDASQWPPQRVEQVITGNLSPYLPGVRVHAIAPDAARTRYAYAIEVPQGTTAYQASDRRYYGRSEYQSLPLPDHEVRLRMFRGKVPSAALLLTHMSRRVGMLPFSSVKFYSGHEYFPDLSDDEPVAMQIFDYSIGLQNTGEINITEFKATIDDGRPGRQDSAGGWVGGVQTIAPPRALVFPRDVYHVTGGSLYLPEDLDVSELDEPVSWTLFLSNTLPTTGQFHLFAEWEERFKGRSSGEE